jgi:hypothetical protein
MGSPTSHGEECHLRFIGHEVVKRAWKPSFISFSNIRIASHTDDLNAFIFSNVNTFCSFVPAFLVARAAPSSARDCRRLRNRWENALTSGSLLIADFVRFCGF